MPSESGGVDQGLECALASLKRFIKMLPLAIFENFLYTTYFIHLIPYEVSLSFGYFNPFS